jgi:nucleotide-binding universal stress UspA family protein
VYRIIVVGTDCTARADRAVWKAAELARVTGATLHLVCSYHDSATALAAVCTAPGVMATDWRVDAIRDHTAHLDELAARLRADGVDVHTRIEQGSAASALVSTADAVDADLLVVGDRGLKGVRGLMGSVPNRVTHRACLDVLVVHTS